jgi:hypothetical protein
VSYDIADRLIAYRTLRQFATGWVLRTRMQGRFRSAGSRLGFLLLPSVHWPKLPSGIQAAVKGCSVWRSFHKAAERTIHRRITINASRSISNYVTTRCLIE